MIITIARQCGCGAVRVGRLLAEHYGIPFYTRKNLMEMAEERGILDEMEAFFDETPVDELLFSMSSLGENQKLLTEKTSSCFGGYDRAGELYHHRTLWKLYLQRAQGSGIRVPERWSGGSYRGNPGGTGINP